MDGTEAAVRELVVAFLGGDRNVEALEEEVSSIAWDAPSPLANRVEHILLDRDVLTAEQLREELSRSIGTIVIEQPSDRTWTARGDNVPVELNLAHATSPSTNEIIQRRLVASAHS
jgi:hypothetical protein